jgi:predicted nucleotidyltransferase
MDLINKYAFGSRVYGTFNESSDYDYVLVISDDSINKLLNHYVLKTQLVFNQLDNFIWSKCLFDMRHWTFLFEHEDNKISYILITETHFKSMIHANIIWVLELIYSDHKFQSNPTSNNQYLEYYKTQYNVDKIIAGAKYESSYAFTKAKIFFGKDKYRGLKNIFHGFRFLIYAIQLLQHKSLVDLSAANMYLDRNLQKFNLHWINGNQTLSMLKKTIDEYKSIENSYVDYPCRIIPNWLQNNYKCYDLRTYSNNDIILPVYSVKYMDKIIVSSNLDGLTKYDIIHGTNTSQPYLETIIIGGELIMRFNNILAKF